MPRAIEDSVVVITGASSGIGRATAIALAERGASVVLAARDESALHDVAGRCKDAGGHALVIPTDVTDHDAVEDLAHEAALHFGRIDVWLNDAGVILYGSFETAPLEEFCRVISVNLFGQIYGARAVLPHFRKQDSGVLINLSSVWGRITAPYVSSYVTSKFGVRAFSECLRQDLTDSPNIHVCTILPESVDTPIFRHAANYTGRTVRPIPPVTNPDRVVRSILRCIEHPQEEITVGWTGHLLEWGHFFMPRLYSKLVMPIMRSAALGKKVQGPDKGNLFEPMTEENRVLGGWRSQHRPVKLALLSGGLLAGVTLYRAQAK